MKHFLSTHIPSISIVIFLLIAWLFAIEKDKIAGTADSILLRFDESSEYSKQSLTKAKAEKGSPMKEKFQIKGLRYAQRKVGEVVAIPASDDPAADPFPLYTQMEDFAGFLADSCLRDWGVVPPVPCELQKDTSPLTLFDRPYPADPGSDNAPQWNFLHFTAGSGIIAPGSALTAQDPKQWYLYDLSTKLQGKKNTMAKLVFSSDGYICIRWNGKEVYRSSVPGECRKDKVAAVDIPLNESVNRLDIRIAAPGAKANFFVRLTTIFDDPLLFSGPEINF